MNFYKTLGLKNSRIDVADAFTHHLHWHKFFHAVDDGVFSCFLICNFDFGCKVNTFIIDKRKILTIS